MDGIDSVSASSPDPTGAFDRSGDAIQVAARVAHEFNNLLTSILGHAALVRPEVAEGGMPCLDQVERAAQRAAELSRQLQAFAGQQGAPPVTRSHVFQIVKDMEPLLRAVVRGRISLALQLDPHTPAVDAESTCLRHLVVHLVLAAVNAAGDAHATVTVETSVADLDGRACRALRSYRELDEGEFVCLDVRYERHDETALTHSLERLLTPRGEPMVHALGAGLQVRVLENGEEARVALPLAVQLSESSAWGVPGLAPDRERLILVVDDERPVRDLAREMLEAAGMSALTASDGRDALDVFRRHERHVACVVMDLRMPNMDGAQAARELLGLRPDLPIVLSSGYQQDADLDSLFELEHVQFLPKPYTQDMLVDKVRALLRGP
jgi:CheY-like chemotaxis protein